MCIDFVSLNKACPKDDFPLPRISTLVDSAADCELLSLLDYFFRIPSNLDEPGRRGKNKLHHSFRNVLLQKNGRGVTQRRVNLHPHDNKSIQRGQSNLSLCLWYHCTKQTQTRTLRRTFNNLHNMGFKLNLEKCIFGISKGKLLSCLISARGIEANLEKIDAIFQHGTPNLKKTSTEAHGKTGGIKQIHFKVHRARAPLLWSTKNIDPYR